MGNRHPAARLARMPDRRPSSLLSNPRTSMMFYNSIDSITSDFRQSGPCPERDE